MNDIYLIRHGETEWNAQGRFQGRLDSILTNTGVKQAEAIGIARQINHALGTASTVLNVGAGTGSYEPTDRKVTAVEPSIEMIRKRKSSSAPVIQASAEHLPFDDQSFDAAMAILTKRDLGRAMSRTSIAHFS